MLGKSIYTDEVCATKAAQRDLALSDSAGIVSPSKERAAEADLRRAAEKAYQEQMAPIISEPARSHKVLRPLAYNRTGAHEFPAKI